MKVRIKLLVYEENKGFYKIKVSRKLFRLLHLLWKDNKLKHMKLFSMREISPVDEANGLYINIGNIDFSFTRVLQEFDDTCKVEYIINNKVIHEYCNEDRYNYLLKDSIQNNYTFRRL